ncbi:BGTF surface domain-containing protein [Natrarchaeobius sp. A-rgal3]|uniref:BGTF surface domain-containing protein n=1 Tax=Natrarchaeobius versutus TaxID=1679078 RepID=UPI00351058F5
MALQRVSSDRRTRRLLLGLLVLAVGSAVLAVPVAGEDVQYEYANGLGFDDKNTSYEAEQTETAEMGVENTGSEPFEFEIGSSGDHFHLDAEIVPAEDETTIELDTANVGDDDPSTYLSATDATVRNVTVHNHEIADDELPGGVYSIRVDNEGAINTGTLVVEPTVRSDTPWFINRSDIERNGTVMATGTTGIEPGETITIELETQDDDDAYRLTDETTVDDNGEFAAALDLSAAPTYTRLRVTFEHDGVVRESHPISIHEDLPIENPESESNGIAIVTDGEQLELEAAPDQQFTGEADLEEGETVDVHVQTTEGRSILISRDATVDEYGTFDVTFEHLEEIEPGTDVVVVAEAADDPAVNATVPGIVVEPTEATERTTSDSGSETELDDGDREDDATLPLSLSTVGIGALAAGTVLSLVGIGTLLGFGRFRFG